MPYDAKCGLKLPARLDPAEIPIIAVAAASPIAPASPWYLGDLLTYLQDRPEHRDIYHMTREQLGRAGFRDQTLHNYKSVSRRFPLNERDPQVSWFVHSLVCVLPKAQRQAVLRQIADEHLTVDQARLLVRAKRGHSRRERLENEITLGIKDLFRTAQGPAVERQIQRLQKLLEKVRDLRNE
jgi:hypothetical protein